MHDYVPKKFGVNIDRLKPIQLSMILSENRGVLVQQHRHPKRTQYPGCCASLTSNFLQFLGVNLERLLELLQLNFFLVDGFTQILQELF